MEVELVTKNDLWPRLLKSQKQLALFFPDSHT